MSAPATRIEGARPWRIGAGLRLFLTGWLVFGLHFATNVVREHYPAFSLAERGTLRVDPYLGLHPDLFELPGRGAFINNNPGASIFAAIPYAIARPFVDVVVARVQAARAARGDAPTAEYDDPRPNRRRFFAQVRERGLDVRFGLASIVIQLGLVAPFGALTMVVMRRWLRRAGVAPRAATALALLYGFGTPIFFRSAFLSQNLFVSHFLLLAVAALPLRHEPAASPGRLAAAGLALGTTVLCDYSGVVAVLAVGLWALADAWRREGDLASGIVRTLPLVLATCVPIAVLLGYQAWAFGHPLYPAQRYMPETEWSGAGWRGMALPAPDLLLQNLFDLRFGIFPFGPLLLLALAAPVLGRRHARVTDAGLRALALGFFAGLLVFSSANQYARLQWNTGVRYLVPVVPLLFPLVADVLLRLPRQLAAAIGVLAIAHAWALAMVREDVPASLIAVATAGLQLPWLTVLGKMRGQYVEGLAAGPPSPLFCMLVASALLGVLWWPFRGVRRRGASA